MSGLPYKVQRLGVEAGWTAWLGPPKDLSWFAACGTVGWQTWRLKPHGETKNNPTAMKRASSPNLNPNFLPNQTPKTLLYMEPPGSSSSPADQTDASWMPSSANIWESVPIAVPNLE